MYRNYFTENILTRCQRILRYLLTKNAFYQKMTHLWWHISRERQKILKICFDILKVQSFAQKHCVIRFFPTPRDHLENLTWKKYVFLWIYPNFCLFMQCLRVNISPVLRQISEKFTRCTRKNIELIMVSSYLNIISKKCNRYTFCDEF